eukprot:GHVO01023962.1.p1 GENE.GHVO01023962.1~~GHVO01023962.1.p1  ORF type:complete len:121 (+),score=10.49 GHVO01023962.1:159-521(+)
MIHCAEDIGKEKFDDSPFLILLVSDNMDVKANATMSHPLVRTLNIVPQHIYYGEDTEEALLTSLTEVFILSLMKYLVASMSGFSKTARALGQIDTFVEMVEESTLPDRRVCEDHGPFELK